MVLDSALLLFTKALNLISFCLLLSGEFPFLSDGKRFKFFCFKEGTWCKIKSRISEKVDLHTSYVTFHVSRTIFEPSVCICKRNNNPYISVFLKCLEIFLKHLTQCLTQRKYSNIILQ